VQKFCNRAENCCIAIEQMREKLLGERAWLERAERGPVQS